MNQVTFNLIRIGYHDRTTNPKSLIYHKVSNQCIASTHTKKTSQMWDNYVYQTHNTLILTTPFNSNLEP